MKKYDSIEESNCPKCGFPNYKTVQYVYKGRNKGKLSLTCLFCGYKDHRLPIDTKNKNDKYIWDNN